VGKSRARGLRQKTTGSHTTTIPLVDTFLRALNRIDPVEKISLGIIKPRLPVAPRRVKIMQEGPTVLLLKVRDTNSLQELWVYTKDTTVTQSALVSFAKKEGLGVA
jgi:hypothetical protein